MFSGTYAEQAGVAGETERVGRAGKRRSRAPVRRGGPHRWKPRHIRAARLRARGAKWFEVAAQLGVHERTVERYASLPGWDNLVREELGEEGRKLLDEAFLPILKNMIRIAEQRRDSDDSTPETKDAVKAAEWVRSLWEAHGPLRERDDEVPPGGAPAGGLGSVTVAGSIRTKVVEPPAQAVPPADSTARSRQRGDEDGDV